MLFRKKIDPSCTYCRYGAHLEDGTILCSKKGFQTEDHPCFRFRYDPCKRIPKKPKALDFTRFHTEDFSL